MKHLKPQDVHYLIVHHSAFPDGKTLDWAKIRRYHTHKLGWQAIGYHFGIDCIKDTYEVLLGRLWTTQGAHCLGYNDCSLGICCVGNFDIEQPEDSQLMVLKNLVRSLLEVFHLDRDAVKGHYNFRATNCPGKFFPLGEFKRSL